MYYIIKEDNFRFVISSKGEFAIDIQIDRLSDETIIKFEEYIYGDFFKYNTGAFDTSIIDIIYPREAYKSSNNNFNVIESTVEELCLALNKCIMCSEPMVLYVGAGVSAYSGIPTDRELQNALYLNDFERLCELAVLAPFVIKAKYKMICRKLMTSHPNIIHDYMAYFQNIMHAIIVTENMDNLLKTYGFEHLNPYVNYDQVANIEPVLVLFLGVGNPQCRRILGKWNDNAIFYAISCEKPSLGEYNCRWICSELTILNHINNEISSV